MVFNKLNNSSNSSQEEEEEEEESGGLFWGKSKSPSKTIKPWVLGPTSSTTTSSTSSTSSTNNSGNGGPKSKYSYASEEYDYIPNSSSTIIKESSTKTSFDFFRKASSGLTTTNTIKSSTTTITTATATATTTTTTATSTNNNSNSNNYNKNNDISLKKTISDLSNKISSDNYKLSTSSTSTLSSQSTLSQSTLSTLSTSTSSNSIKNNDASQFKRSKSEIEYSTKDSIEPINKSYTSIDLKSNSKDEICNINSTFDNDEEVLDFSKPKPPPKKTAKELAQIKKEREKEEREKEKEKSKKVFKTPTSSKKKKILISNDSELSTPSSQASSSSSQDKQLSRSKLKKSKEDVFEDKVEENENSLISSRVLSQSFESNELHYEEANRIIKSLGSNDSKVILATLGQLSRIVTEQSTEFTLILRSHNLFTPLCDSLMSLCLFKHDTTTTTKNISSNKKSNTPSNLNSKNSSSNKSPSVKRSNSLDSLKKNNSNNIDLLSLFLSTTANDGSSEISDNVNINSSSIKNSREFDSSTDTEDETDKIVIKKKHKSNSGLTSASIKNDSSINNNTSSENDLTERERKAVYLASCFILFAFSNDQANIEHFSRGTIEFLYSQAIKIPENYLLEFYSTPSRLPKSPKSPKSPSSGVSPKKMIELEINIFSQFQILVSDTVRFSVSTPSLSLATLSNIASNHINHSTKLRLKEFGLMDGMVKLLSKYIDYLNPILDLSSISPKLIGNIEYILKIIDQCLIGDIKANRVLLLTKDTLSMFLTYIRYLHIAINSNNDRLAGLDIKVIGSEAIISILNILLNITHDNFEASKLINQITKPFNYINYNSNNNNNNNSDIDNINNNINSNINNKNKSPINNKNEFGINKEFSEYLESISNSKFTPKKVKFLESIEIKDNFAFKVIIQLLKLEVPEKYDICQLCISLLVNLVEINPENREILHNMEGAIESILQLFIWRTSDTRIITRVTTKTQEKIASSYLVILIGYLIKDHTENRELVIKTLPNHSFDEMIKLLMDFIEFQFNSEILTDEFYKLVCGLIDDVFLIDKSSSISSNHSAYSNEIKLKYQSFKNEFDKKLNSNNTINN